MIKNNNLDFLKNNIIVDNPHYGGRIETIEYIQDKLSKDQFEGYLLGNVLKYISRCDKKGNKKQDLQKALTYLIWAIEYITENEEEQEK